MKIIMALDGCKCLSRDILNQVTESIEEMGYTRYSNRLNIGTIPTLLSSM